MIANDEELKAQIEEHFLRALRHHLAGWRQKVQEDFSQATFESELAKLKSDPVYSKFSLDSPQYVLVRLMGRMSISIGRRLGEIYDKLPRFVAAARFAVPLEEIAHKLGGLELDVCVVTSRLSAVDAKLLERVVHARFRSFSGFEGVGIEIRYNFNPNDSARLRKDVRMAGLVQEARLFPIYLIFSAISPRDEAIARLQRAGWNFLVGDVAASFMRELVGMDLGEILDGPKVKNQLKQEINAIMQIMFDSYAFTHVLRNNRS